MKELIDVFRMNELTRQYRARLIIMLGIAINRQYGMNITEALVYELVSMLDPEHSILKNEHYKKAYQKTIEL